MWYGCRIPKNWGIFWTKFTHRQQVTHQRRDVFFRQSGAQVIIDPCQTVAGARGDPLMGLPSSRGLSVCPIQSYGCFTWLSHVIPILGSPTWTFEMSQRNEKRENIHSYEDDWDNMYIYLFMGTLW